MMTQNDRQKGKILWKIITMKLMVYKHKDDVDCVCAFINNEDGREQEYHITVFSGWIMSHDFIVIFNISFYDYFPSFWTDQPN